MARPLARSSRSLQSEHGLLRKPALELFQGDGFHPTPTGSYLAALVIYAGLTGRDVTGLVERTAPATLPAADFEVIEAAAAWAIQQHGNP